MNKKKKKSSRKRMAERSFNRSAKRFQSQQSIQKHHDRILFGW